uniref:Si:dkey-238m4.3 n=1 Tax=Astyanax mexicanus TaxID=7994 RepID=A0A3B1IXC0_ASTMX
MSASTSGRKTPVDYGVQIRFIKDLHDTGGGHGGQSRREGSSKSPSRYGVAVRVQGIAGQPYVVLKEGEKGDSYGVQLRTQPRDASLSYNSLPRRDDGSAPGQYLSSTDGSPLRRAQSHGSLLDRDGSDDFGRDARRPPGDGRSGSYGNLDAGIGLGSERERARGGMERNQWGGSHQTGLNGSVERETLRGGNVQYAGRTGSNQQSHFSRPSNSSSGPAGSVGS